MNIWLGATLIALALQASDTETKVIEYLKKNIQPGQPVIVSELANEVFTTAKERKVLSELYN